jgi:hypothetical protein
MVIVSSLGKKLLVNIKQDATNSKCFNNLMLSRKPYSHI